VTEPAPEADPATLTASPPRSARRFVLALGAIALLALVWRVGYVVVVKGDATDTCDREVCGDALWYAAMAKRLSDGTVFTHPVVGGPSADHPPLTSLVMAPASVLVDGTFVQRLLMATIGAGVVVVIGLLAREVARGAATARGAPGDTARGAPGGVDPERVGLLAAGIAAVYPNLWMNDVVVMAETLTALLVAAVLLVVYRYRTSPRPGLAAAAGGLVGLAALARSEQTLLGLLIVAPAILLVRPLPLRRRVGHVALAGAVALAVVAPWIGWNMSRFAEPTTLSTNDGLTLLGANCEEVYQGPAVGFWSLRCGLEVLPGGDSSQLSARQREAAFDYISSHQRDLPRVAAFRVARVWSLYNPSQMAWLNQGEGRERVASWAGFAMYLALLPAAAIGAVHLHRRGVAVWPLLMTFVIVTLTALLFYGIVRFRVPAEVAIVVLAGAGIDAAWRRWVTRRGSVRPVPAPA
jgi:4-amino-4-deoxy-L-arabinose transferase-like glycosyltransferase